METRYERGWRKLKEIDGEVGEHVIESLRDVAPDLGRYVIEFPFGDVYSRPGLGLRERELATVAALTALGHARPQLQVHLEAALNVGVTREEVVETILQMAVYAGFPAALNGMSAAREVFARREARGLLAPERTVRLGDHETRLVDTGGEGEPFILLHSVGLDRQVWRDVVPRLAEGRRVIAYDLRAHGHAAGAPRPFTLDTLAGDLRALMDALGVRRAHVVGFSLGGAVAQQFALASPERLASLSLVCTMAKAQDAFLKRAEAAERDGMRTQVVPTLLRWFTPAALAEDLPVVRYARERVRAMDVGGWSATWRALAGVDTFGRLNRLDAPVHVIAGELDPSTPPALMREFSERIPGARFHVVPGAPHMLPLEKPAELAALLREGAL